MMPRSAVYRAEVADRAERIARLYRLGLSTVEVSAIAGCGITTVFAALRDRSANRSHEVSARLSWRHRHVVEPLMADWLHNRVSVWELTERLRISYQNSFL